jgi:hypothetical protein
MGPFDLDFSHVQNVVAPPDRIPVLGNEHRMVRVAFDLFRLDGDDEERLWQVQTAEDGNEFLVRTYDLPEDVEDGLESRSADWSVMTDSKFANLTVAYRGVPIHRLAAADYGAWSPDEVRMLRQLVSEKLASDKAWAARFLHDLPPAKLAALRETFPEFSKIAADDPAGFPPPEGLVEAGERLKAALKAQGGYEALSAEQQELFNRAADKLMDIKLPGASLDKQSAKALLSELDGLISEFEAGAEGASEEAGQHGYPPEVEHFDLESAEDMYKLAAMALPYTLQWVQAEMQTTTEQLQKEVADALKRGGKVVRVSRGGKEPPHGSIWFYKSIGMREADDEPVSGAAPKDYWDLLTDFRIELAGRGGAESDKHLSEEEKAAAKAVWEKLQEFKETGEGAEEIAALMQKFEQVPMPALEKHPEYLVEGTRRLLRSQEYQNMTVISRLVKVAEEMGGSYTRRQELPMAVFSFGYDDEKAKEFLAQADRQGFEGMRVGPGWAAVKLPY